jgi:hypothetical protein
MTGFIALNLCSAGWLAAIGQTTTATLSGVVHDPTHAVLPQVKITLKNSAKRPEHTLRTDRSQPASKPGAGIQYAARRV